IASSVTVEKVPTCFFMPVSTSSIFSPDRRPYNAFQSPFLSWARSEQGNRIRKHINAAFFHQELRRNHGVVGRARRCKWDEGQDWHGSRRLRASHETVPRLVPTQGEPDFLALSESSQ